MQPVEYIVPIVIYQEVTWSGRLRAKLFCR